MPAVDLAVEQDETKESQSKYIGLFLFSILSLFVGIITGFGAFLFRILISIIHNIFFLGKFSLFYDSNAFTPEGPWGAWIILAPVIGGMGVVFLVRTFAPEARGHGVPEVIYAIYHRAGRIRPIVAFVKALASALAIGSGAAVGREGPIIQIGSSVASTIGHMLRLAQWQRITLVAAGAGAGIAATFNTPLGGVMFAIELMLPEVSTRTFVPVVIATASATYIGRLFLGIQPAFTVLYSGHASLGSAAEPVVLLASVGLGLLSGLGAWAFIRLLSFMEDTFERMPGNDYTRHAIGMVLVGLVMYALMRTQGHYFIEGVGYATIQGILQDNITSIYLLALIFVAKMFATTTSLGSGSSGGVFSPALILGATLGASWGWLIELIIPGTGFGTAEFAMIGMAGMVSGATGAALTAAVMIFEMTQDYSIMVPTVIAVATAVGLRRSLSTENIYTIKLARRGIRIPKDRHSNMFLVHQMQDIMDTEFDVMPAETPLVDAIENMRDKKTMHVVITKEERVAAILRLDPSLYEIENMLSGATLGALADNKFVLLRTSDTVFDTLKRMSRRSVENGLVIKGDGKPGVGDILGVISKRDLGDMAIGGFSPYTD